MERRAEGKTEEPPAREAGENCVKRIEAEILVSLAMIIDFQRTQEYEEVLERAAQGESEI